MSTLGDVRKLVSSVLVDMTLYGASGTSKESFDAATRKIGQSILEDGMTREEASSLPGETELGPKADAAFQELVTLVAPQMARR